MSKQEFRELVKKMREVQIEFFSGNKSVMNKSKGLERLVDQELGIGDLEADDQLTLF